MSLSQMWEDLKEFLEYRAEYKKRYVAEMRRLKLASVALQAQIDHKKAINKQLKSINPQKSQENKSIYEMEF